MKGKSGQSAASFLLHFEVFVPLQCEYTLTCYFMDLPDSEAKIES